MNISKTTDKTVTSLEKVDWEQVTKEAIDLWVSFFKAIVALAIITYFTGEAIGQGVHSLNDWIAHHWVRLIVPSNSVGTEQAPIVEVLSGTAVEVEPILPPAPLVVQDPWSITIEVEPKLPQVLEPMAILFTTPPLMLAAVQAPLALLAPARQEQQTPARSRRRRQSAPPAVAVTEPAHTPTQRPRGRRAHARRHKAA